MAAITIILQASTCGHLRFALTGAKTLEINTYIDDMLGTISDDDITVFLKVVTKLAKSGRTNTQARTLLQNGITVTV